MFAPELRHLFALVICFIANNRTFGQGLSHAKQGPKYRKVFLNWTKLTNQLCFLPSLAPAITLTFVYFTAYLLVQRNQGLLSDGFDGAYQLAIRSQWNMLFPIFQHQKQFSKYLSSVYYQFFTKER